MNADARSFPPEIVKRSLMIYTRTALPGDDTGARRRLQRSVAGIREGLTTSLYRHYLKRVISEVEAAIESGDEDTDVLALSSSVLCEIFEENLPSDTTMPEWCQTMTLEEYQERAFERPRLVLNGLLNVDRYSKERRPPEGCWTISGASILVTVPTLGFSRALSDIPDWILDDTGSSSGQIALKRQLLENFLGREVKAPRRWLPFLS